MDIEYDKQLRALHKSLVGLRLETRIVYRLLTDCMKLYDANVCPSESDWPRNFPILLSENTRRLSTRQLAQRRVIATRHATGWPKILADLTSHIPKLWTRQKAALNALESVLKWNRSHCGRRGEQVFVDIRIAIERVDQTRLSLTKEPSGRIENLNIMFQGLLRPKKHDIQFENDWPRVLNEVLGQLSSYAQTVADMIDPAMEDLEHTAAIDSVQLRRDAAIVDEKPDAKVPQVVQWRWASGTGPPVNPPHVPPAAQRAWSQFEQATMANPDPSTDKSAYQWVKDNHDANTDGPLPDCNTWCRYLRVYRNATGQQKNKPRHGRRHGRSVASQRDI